jgi:hypothetical protein
MTLRAAARLSVSLAVLAVGAPGPQPAEARFPGPKTANIYIRNHYEPGDTELLSRFDLLALDVDTPPAIVEEIRSYGTGTIILAFIPSNGTYMSALQFPDGSIWREVYEAAKTHDWWFYNTAGGQVSDHGGKWTTNITTQCPPNAMGQTILDWFPKFVVHTMLKNGNSVWDGVFLDDCWVGIHWITLDTELNPFPLDANRDGVADTQAQVDGWWKAGTDTLVSRIRQQLPADMIVMGNGQNKFYSMNGAMIENFPFTARSDTGCPYNYSWTWDMLGTYGYLVNEASYNPSPARVNMNNSKWIWGDRYNPIRSGDFEKFKEFTLVSAMLGDGYYSLDWYDLPDTKKSHHSIWWESEYDIPFGNALGPPYQLTRSGVTIWRRDFEGGSVVLNPAFTAFGPSIPDSLPLVGAREAKLIPAGEFYFPDLIAPARVMDLTITQAWPESLEIQWTNVGDDGFEGSAVSLTIRTSVAGPLTDANFSTGKRLLPAVAPDIAGEVQRTTIRGLTSGTLYHVALRHGDESSNWAPVSPNASIVVGPGVSGTPGGGASTPVLLGVPAPNPSRGRVTIPFSGSPEAGALSVTILDAAGRLVRTLHQGTHPGGLVDLEWDGRTSSGAAAPSGLYFAKLEGDHTRSVRRITLAR